LAWERLWRILLAPPTEAEKARLHNPHPLTKKDADDN
jgi:hypothetical protein